ncbi:MAG: sensor histidine kinase N-terminal domain-containing protein, partial [Acidobacteriota bacterium]
MSAIQSIRWRLVLGLLGGSGALLVAGLLSLWLQISRRVVADFDANLLAEGRALTSLVAVNGGDIRLDFADEAMPQFSAATEPAYFEVRRKDGELVQRSDSLGNLTLGPERMPLSPESIDGVVLGNGVRTRRVTLLTSPLQRESDESKEEPEEQEIHLAAATVYVAVAHGTARMDAFLDRLGWGILGFGGSMLVGIWLVILATLRWSLSPLDRLSCEVQRLDADSLGNALVSHGLPAELQPIVHQINALLHRLELAFRKERDFSANVAHELRTPLAELR